MTDNAFFSEVTDQSLVKIRIVKKYFVAWARMMKKWSRSKRINYLDLFAGPGYYEDEKTKERTESTPLLILREAIADPVLCEILVTIFNDKDKTNVHLLDEAIKKLPKIDKLNNSPIIRNCEIGLEIVKYFQRIKFEPTLCFADPWGYKGLSLDLINAVLKDWGCDCIFFFNYNRVRMGLRNARVEEHMNALFSEDRANELRSKLKSVSPDVRELTIIEEFCKAIEIDPCGRKRFVLTFPFKNSRGSHTTHHLIFVSKDSSGYNIMKDIMAKESTSHKQGILGMEFNPVDDKQPLLFDFSVDELAEDLLAKYAGRIMTLEEIFTTHNVDTPYVKKDYKDALIKLEQEGKITTNPPVEKRLHRKGVVTFADHVQVTFKPRKT